MTSRPVWSRGSDTADSARGQLVEKRREIRGPGSGDLVRTSRSRVDGRAIATLSAGHLVTDIAQGSVPALLAFLVLRDHLSYAAVSALILGATVSSSVIQPLFGHVCTSCRA